MSGIPVWAVKGAKVVCVLHVKDVVTLRHKYPIKDGIYTIRKVVIDSVTGIPALLLEEIVNSTWQVQSRLEPGFNINGFRPLVTKSQEQDIALFRHHLDGVDA